MVGIGGIGMSALAQLLVYRGHTVAGSDRDESPVVLMLAEKGIPVAVGHDECNIPAECELLIYSDAVPEMNGERVRAKEMGIPEMSYFEALGTISKDARTIAVAGTHGKTTTTGMLAKILQFCEKEPTAIVGSIMNDFRSNFLPGREDLLVVEACEYRDHLLKLSPTILVITNLELDHTDYFPNLEALQATFRKAVKKVPVEGCIVADPYDENVAAVLGDAKAPIIDYTTQTIPALKQIGEFNRNNARAAKAAARAAFPHLQEAFTDRALIAFEGSWRRFEYRGETPEGAIVYDDYAHHPTAIRSTVEAARGEFQDKRIVIAFHPHLYSRTRDLMGGFATSLALADRVLVAPIYAAREEPIQGITNTALAEAVNEAGGNAEALDSFEKIRDALLTEGDDALIITMGAGDIYKVAEQIAD
jgi:UDP-N-acetylmuramate--alanine ligase